MKIKKRVFFLVCAVIIVITLFSITMYAATVTITDSYGTVSISPSTKNYVVQNNVWNDSQGTQTLSVDDQNGDFTVTSANHNKSTSSSPASYPSIFKGSHWGNITNNSGMPKQVGSINTCSTSWSFTNPTSTAYDVAYDVWLNKTNNMSYKNPDGLEVMVWLGYAGPIQPVGSKVTTVTINGENWDLWYGSAGSWNVVSYKRTSTTTNGSQNLKNFIVDSTNRGYCQSSWYLVDIEAGTELWQGGAGFKSTGFSATVK